jgi:hypothetical protein
MEVGQVFTIVSNVPFILILEGKAEQVQEPMINLGTANLGKS